MDYGLVTLAAELPQQPPHLPLAEADLLGGLLLACFWVISFFSAFLSATSRSRSRCVIRSCPWLLTLPE